MLHVKEMRLHHPYLNDEGGGIGKNHMDKCQQDRLMYQMLIAIRSERVDRSNICSGKAHVLVQDLLRHHLQEGG